MDTFRAARRNRSNRLSNKSVCTFLSYASRLFFEGVGKMAQVESRTQYWIIWDRKNNNKTLLIPSHDPPPRAAISWKIWQSIKTLTPLVDNILYGRMWTVYDNPINHWPKIVSIKHASRRLASSPANLTRLEMIGVQWTVLNMRFGHAHFDR